MAPELYGIEHILYLIISFVIMAISIILTKKFVKNDKVLTIIIKSIAGVLLLTVILNRLFIVFVQETPNWLDFIPNTYCGLSSYVLALSVLLTKRNSSILHFVVYIAFVGGLATMFYPDFIGQANSIFYSKTITGLLHHTLQVFLILMMMINGYFKTDIKKWYCVPLGLACYMTWGLFLNDIIGISAMQIGRDFEGISGLTWFSVGMIFFFAYAVYVISYELVRRHIEKKKQKTN